MNDLFIFVVIGAFLFAFVWLALPFTVWAIKDKMTYAIKMQEKELKAVNEQLLEIKKLLHHQALIQHHQAKNNKP